MTQRLVVHVGANKTGSSAIQGFLALNRRGLRDQGVVVPNEQLTVSERGSGAHVFMFQDLLSDPDRGRDRLAESLSEVSAHVPDAVSIVLSAENLTANPAAPALFEGLAERFAVEVVMYIRRQDDFLLSSWQQWNSKIEADFWAWLVANVGLLGNWRTHLEAWEQVVPRGQIKVRVFDRGILRGGDVVRDFYDVLGLDVPVDQWQFSTGNSNPSFSDAVMDLVQGNRLVFKDVHDNDFYDFVRRFTGDAYLKDHQESTLTFRQRTAILRRYQAANQWVRTHYLPDHPAGLFTPPHEADYTHVDPAGQQSQQLTFLTTLLYRMYKESK